MSTDAESTSTQPSPPAVVEWGDPDVPSRRSAALGGVVADRRLVPLVTVLGAVAVMLSLISEWQVTVVDFGDNEIGDRALPAGVGDLAGWAPGYLGGVLLLAAAMTLLVYGPPVVRRSARLAALSTGGVLLALLAAIGSDLGDRSRLNNLLTLTLREEQIRVTYGRGLWCALAGVAAVTIAAYLAGRHLPAHGTPTGSGPAAAHRTDDEPPPDAPLDLTVQPTSPFARPTDDRDRPA